MHLLTIIIRKKAVEIVISGRESKSTTLSDLEQSTNIGGDVTDIVFCHYQFIELISNRCALFALRESTIDIFANSLRLCAMNEIVDASRSTCKKSWML
jgi:hypothetical protein